jgi:hypothetical protein
LTEPTIIVRALSNSKGSQTYYWQGACWNAKNAIVYAGKEKPVLRKKKKTTLKKIANFFNIIKEL